MSLNRSGSRRMLVAHGRIACRNATRPALQVATTTPQSIRDGVRSGLSLAHLTEHFTERFLTVRRRHLDSAPKSGYVVNVRRDMGAGKVKPMQMLLACVLADLEDGVPAESVADTFAVLADLIRVEGMRLRGETVNAPSLLPVIKRQNRSEDKSNASEDDVIANENDPKELYELLDDYAATQVDMDRARAAIHQKLAVLELNGLAGAPPSAGRPDGVIPTAKPAPTPTQERP